MNPYGKIYVPGQGNRYAKILILGEAPSFEEERQLTSFVGPSGKELNTLLKDAGIHRDECWVTNVSKYSIPPNLDKKKIPFHLRAKSVGIDIDQQLSELQFEINQIKPNIILGLGGSALWALKGTYKISNFRGSIFWSNFGCKAVATYHPAHLLHAAKGGEFKGYWNRQVMILDMKRAKKQSEFNELRLPTRHLEICRDSSHLYNFLQLYKNKSHVWVDIEAGGHCLPICIGIAFTPNHGMVIPLWNKDDISSIPTSDLSSIWQLLSETLWNKDVHGQNFNYDRDKILRIGLKIQSIKGDTMLKAFAINPELPKGLAFNTSIFTEEPFYKDEGMYEGSIKDLLIGCARDACVTCEIDLAMDHDLDELGQREFYEQFLLKLPDFYLEIEQNGFRVDEEKRLELLKKYVEWDERIRFELYQLTELEVNVNSPKQIAFLLFEILSLPKRAGTGEEELTALLNLQSFTDTRKRRVVELILEDRRVRKTISTNLLAIPDYDGRMKTTCFPCLETGRSSNGQQEPPIRPYVEVRDEDGKKKKRAMGAAFQTMTKHGDIGADVREMYVPY